MTQSQSRLGRSIETIGRIDIHSPIGSNTEVCLVAFVEASTKIQILGRLPILDIEHERHSLGIHSYLISHSRHGHGQHQESH